MNIPYHEREALQNTCLSNSKVLEVYHQACRFVQDWTQAIDYGPFEQVKTIKFSDDEPDALGPCEQGNLSTMEFFEMKKYQVDQDYDLDTLTKLYNCMYHVDLMGNLLSNQKLAFYEYPVEKNFLSRILIDGGVKDQRGIMAKSYSIIQEIYNDMLTPIRQKLVESPEWKIEDRAQALLLGKALAHGTVLDEIASPLLNIKLVRESDSLYSWYATHILCVDCFKDTDEDFLAAITGVGLTEHRNTQAVLLNKINILIKQMENSQKSHDFELLFYIQLL